MADIDIFMKLSDAFVMKYRLFLFGNKSSLIQLPQDILEIIFEKFIYDSIEVNISIVYALIYYPKIGIRVILNNIKKHKRRVSDCLCYSMIRGSKYCNVMLYIMCVSFAHCPNNELDNIIRVFSIYHSLYFYIYYISITDAKANKKIVFPILRLIKLLSIELTNNFHETQFKELGSILPLEAFKKFEKKYDFTNSDVFVQNHLSDMETIDYISSKYVVKQFNTYFIGINNINIVPLISYDINGVLPRYCPFNIGNAILPRGITTENTIFRDKVLLPEILYSFKMLMSHIDELDTIEFHNKTINLNKIQFFEIYHNKSNIQRIIKMNIKGLTINIGKYARFLGKKLLADNTKFIDCPSLFELLFCAPEVIKSSNSWNILASPIYIVKEYLYTVNQINMTQYKKLLNYIPDSMFRILLGIHEMTMFSHCYSKDDICLLYHHTRVLKDHIIKHHIIT